MTNLIWRLLQACTNSNTPAQAKKLTSGKKEKFTCKVGLPCVKNVAKDDVAQLEDVTKMCVAAPMFRRNLLARKEVGFCQLVKTPGTPSQAKSPLSEVQ